MNPAWLRIYGYRSEEVIGQTPSLLHSGMQTSDFYSEMWASIRDSKIGYWKGELVNRTKNGKFMPVLLTITPHTDTTGVSQGYMGIAVDMSAGRASAYAWTGR